MPNNGRHFIGVTRSGTMLENPKAFETDEELIADQGDVNMAFDDDRMVPYYVWYEEGRPPTLIGYVQAYTGGSRAITDDAWWLLIKNPSIFYKTANALGEKVAQAVFSSQKTGFIILAVGGLISLLLLLMSFGGGEPADTASQPEPPPVVETVQPKDAGDLTLGEIEQMAAPGAAPEAP